jgi:glycosyltransferase involved in cell wall biosynthesis
VTAGEEIAVSVVVPAHDEAAVVARCLRALSEGAAPNELELVVVCNGCTDATAAIARAVEGTHVVELPVASKPAALNAGDAVATRFPRFYVDADVVLRIDALRATAALLAGDSEVMCAAPKPAFELSGRSWPIRAFYNAWNRMPYLDDDVVGTGVYALSERGRARFGAFPDLVADDQFVLQHFEPGERRSLRDHGFTVFPPTTLGGLLHIRRRAYRGTRELARSFVPHPARRGRVRAVLELACDPRQVPGLLVYLSVVVAARVATLCSRAGAWERDDSARRAGR